MISAGDFRNGVTFEEDGNVLQVVEFQHVKPGKGAAFVRTKTKNVDLLQQPGGWELRCHCRLCAGNARGGGSDPLRFFRSQAQ